MNILPLVIIAALFCGATMAADNSPEQVVTPYFGLAMPYPDTVPTFVVTPEKGTPLTNRALTAWLSVDEKGRVKKVDYASDLAAYLKPIEPELKKMAFHFMPGVDPGSPIEVPVRVTYSTENQTEKKVTLDSPVSPRLVSDTSLLSLFFDRNGIVPPGLIDLKPLFYKVYPNRQESDYLIITARVFLDENGVVQNIVFPIPGQDVMTHAVLMAIMNAEFRPARIGGRTLPSDLLITFRIFDNIRFPFSPFYPGDTSEAVPISSHYAVSLYYNTADMALPPLPRTHAEGTIQAANLARGRLGTAEVNIRINAEGNTVAVSVIRASPQTRDVAGKVAKLIQWYPARDTSGVAEAFVGTVNLVFNNSPKIVYIPEWLSP